MSESTKELIDLVKKTLPNARTIKISYHGEGDEGNIESIEVDSEEFQEDGGEIAYDVICDVVPGGWEISEGSQGYITIDTATKKIKVTHGWNTIVEEIEEYDLD